MKGVNPAKIIGATREPFQLVYLSNSSSRLRQSLESFIQHYGADRVVVVCPEKSATKMHSLIGELGLKGVVLHDEQLVPNLSTKTEHTSRNFQLRRALYQYPEVEPLFLSLDDDCILLRQLPDNFFVNKGRIIARYSHGSLCQWKADGVHEPTSFDKSLWMTGKLLKERGYPDLGYSAHQAQLIEKDSVNAIYRSLPDSLDFLADEWSLYFNIGQTDYPEIFESKPTTTLFWPQRYAAWLPDWFEDEIWFENRYPDIYEPGGIADKSGISKNTDWRQKVEFCRGGYTTHHALRLLNELSNGQAPTIKINDAVTSSVGQIFGFPGAILKLNVDTADGNEMPAQYLISKQGKPVLETASPLQTVSNNRCLALKLPDNPGEYVLTIGGTKSDKITPNSLPLFVLPFPVGGNS